MKRILLTALCLAIIFTLCAPAGLADETKDDFLLIGGTWSTPYEEYRDKFSVEPVTENQDGIVTTSFQNVKLTSVDASADIDYFKISNSDVTNIVNMYLEVNNAFLFNHNYGRNIA